MSEHVAAAPRREPLAQLPTPLELASRLTTAWGGPKIWIKRDDLTGFGLSGNKVRKLEYHAAAAIDAGATTLMTCGAVQSNHCRATALTAARLGLDCVLYLRSADGQPPDAITGNHLLQRLAGAEVRFISPSQYSDRVALMVGAAETMGAQGTNVWVIPEGASDHLGMVAFDAALTELAAQLAPTGDRRVTVWHASSSAGTTAGLALAAHQQQLPFDIVGSSVGDSSSFLSSRVRELLATADGIDPSAVDFEIIDTHIGLGYGKTTDKELAVQVSASRLTGMIWDPTYTGKAIYALKQEIDAGRFGPDDEVVLWHTGGGFAAFAHDFSGVL